MRSVWKGYYLDIFKTKNNNVILESFLEIKKVYNGKLFSELILKKSMIGLKIGEFVFTRKINVIHKKKNKKK